MNIRECPRCQQRSLVPTGGFWACGLCGLAITQAALWIEQERARTRNRTLPGTLPGDERVLEQDGNDVASDHRGAGIMKKLRRE